MTKAEDKVAALATTRMTGPRKRIMLIEKCSVFLRSLPTRMMRRSRFQIRGMRKRSWRRRIHQRPVTGTRQDEGSSGPIQALRNNRYCGGNGQRATGHGARKGSRGTNGQTIKERRQRSNSLCFSPSSPLHPPVSKFPVSRRSRRASAVTLTQPQSRLLNIVHRLLGSPSGRVG